MLFDADWNAVVTHLIYLGIAYLLAVPVGWNREKHARSAGLRTFPLVAMATCGYMLIGIEVLDTTDAEARVMYGIITGMGFIGGGAILKNDRTQDVSGTATAAALWTTGTIGLAVAWQRFEIALLLSFLMFCTLQFIQPLKERMQAHGED
ncbi:MAG: MgtC/SapB family protein [Pseudomonadota bacterium]|nr:MgtC/SapB family protein [Pseudomonadota bacterium]